MYGKGRKWYSTNLHSRRTDYKVTDLFGSTKRTKVSGEKKIQANNKEFCDSKLHKDKELLFMIWADEDWEL